MGWFKPFKKPNGFKYTPRFYDPVKEAREQRRRELRGESVETDNCEYRPGQYLRTQQQARMERRTLEESRQKSGSSLIIFAVLAIILIVGYILYPRIVNAFATAGDKATVRQAEPVQEEFDPYAPITIVPNDYEE